MGNILNDLVDLIGQFTKVKLGKLFILKFTKQSLRILLIDIVFQPFDMSLVICNSLS